MTTFKDSNQLISKLKQILNKQRLMLALGGFLLTLSVLAAVSVVISLLANIIVLPVWLKISILSITAFLLFYFIGKYIIARFFSGSIDQVALTLEEKYPSLKGRLIATIQFERSKSTDLYSQDLLMMTKKQALEKISDYNVNSVITLQPIWNSIKIFSVSAFVAASLLIIFPGFFSYSYEVYSNATTEVSPAISYELIATPGNSEWVKYRDIEIGGLLRGHDLPKKATVHYRLTGGNWQSSKINLNNLNRTAVTAGDSLNFSITLRQIAKSFDYYVEAGELKSQIHAIDVVNRPRVAGLKLDIFYPNYTGLEPSTIDENNGSFSAVTGSKVTMTITTNLPVETAEIVFEDSSRLPIKIENKTGSIPLLVDRSRSYHIELTDHLGENNPDPIEYYITEVPDEYPTVDIIRPGYDANLGEEMILPLKARMFDDYGFSSLALKYTIFSQGRPSEEHVAILHYSDDIKTEGEIEFNWDMDQFNLFPGDYVGYYLEVADNDKISGPKIGQSRKYIARLPSLDEMIAQNENESRQRITLTDEVLKTNQDLMQRLQKVARKMNSENKHSSVNNRQHQKELESITETNAEMLKKIENMAEQMESSLEKMQENSMVSRQIMEKLAEIQKLYEEVATPEMREAQERLMEALKNMNRDELQKSMEDFQLSQEELLKRLERTAALLKRMALEQKMDAMIRKAEQLLKQQENVNTKTEESQSNELSSLSPQEDAIKQSLESLKKEASDFDQLMKEAQMEDSQEAKEFSEAVKKTDADKNMEQMSQSMKQGDKQQSMSEGEKAESKLAEMLGKMQQMQMAMNNDDSKEIQRAMRKAIDNSNYLSQNQEELLKEAASLDPRSMVLREAASDQQDLASACNGLQNTIAELGKKSPFIAAELQSLVDNALQNMEMASQQFENKNGSEGNRHQRDAMSQLNKTSIRLMESLDQQNQCNNASNCDNGTAQLEKLCNKQNQLNQQTQSQCDNPGSNAGNQGSPQERGALQRLAGEQGSIRKSMEQLAQEFGNSRKILGRLDDIANEMKEIEEALEEGEVGEDVQQRQLKVLSRMLEASRTLQRRDFSEQRQSTTANSNMLHIPSQLSTDILNDEIELEDRLKKFLGDGYPPQYEEQIKSYFKALLKAQAEQRQQLINQ